MKHNNTKNTLVLSISLLCASHMFAVKDVTSSQASTSAAAVAAKSPIPDENRSDLMIINCKNSIASDYVDLANRLPDLKKLYLIDANDDIINILSHITSIENNLEVLNLDGSDKLTDLNPVVGLRKLKSLCISDCTQIKNLGFLVQSPQLESLNLSGCTQMKDFYFLEHLTNLKFLDLSYCNHFHDIRLLEKLTKLQRLNLDGCPRIEDWTFLTELPNFK